jgi:hypothetical protein
MRLDMGGSCVGAPDLRSTLGNMMWIGEKAHIEDQVSIPGATWR